MQKANKTTFLLMLFSAFDKNAIRYCVLRNWESLPENLNGSDLDLLVHPEDIKITHATILSSISEFKGAHLLSYGRKSAALSQYYIIAPATLDSPGVCIDIFTEISYKGCVEIADTNVLLEKSIKHRGIRVLPSGLAALTALIKEVLHNGSTPDRYIPPAIQCIRDNNKVALEALSPLGKSAIAELVNLLLIPASQQQKNFRNFRDIAILESIKRAPLNYYLGQAKEVAYKIHRFINPLGKMIAILGVDGSGKSTLINMVSPVIDAATHRQWTIKHLRPGVLPPLSKLRNSGYPSTADAMPHGKPPSGFLISLFRLAYLTSDYVIGYWMKVRPVLAKNPTIFLFDRYAYDLRIDPLRFRIKLPDLVIRAFLATIPKPDITICLIGDPITISNRKKELSTGEITRQMALLRIVPASKNLRIISVDDTVEASFARLLEEISTKYTP